MFFRYRNLSFSRFRIKNWGPTFDLKIVNGQRRILVKNCTINLKLFFIIIRIEDVLIINDGLPNGGIKTGLKSEYTFVNRLFKKAIQYISNIERYKYIKGIVINEIKTDSVCLNKLIIDRFKNSISIEINKIKYSNLPETIIFKDVSTKITNEANHKLIFNFQVRKACIKAKRVSTTPIVLMLNYQSQLEINSKNYEVKRFCSNMNMNNFEFNLVSEKRNSPFEHLVIKLESDSFSFQRILRYFPNLRKLCLPVKGNLFDKMVIDLALNLETLSHVSELNLITSTPRQTNQDLINYIEVISQSFLFDYVLIEDVSQLFLDILIKSEDPSFFKHQGIDIKNVLNALILNLNQKTLKRGASTITMQLVRNLFLNHGKNFNRKIEEILIALYLELNIFDKERILEMYINIIEFAPNLYGIKNACLYYFNKDSKDIDIAESILLCYIIPRPKYFLEALESNSPQLINNFTEFSNRLLKSLKISKRLTFKVLGYFIDTERGIIHK